MTCQRQVFTPDELAMEEWRAIPGFTGYDVSSLGRVRSWRKKGPGGGVLERPVVMSPAFTKARYLDVALVADNRARPTRKKIHQLVLAAFVGPVPDGQEVRHFPDGSKENNRLANLSYGTRQQNSDDRIVHGTVPAGTRNGNSRARKAVTP